MLAGADVGARADADPRAQVRRRGEARHVGSDLADQTLGHGATDAGNAFEQLGRLTKRAERRLQPGVDRREGAVEGVDEVEVQPEVEAVLVGDMTAQRLEELAVARLDPALLEPQERLGFVVPSGDGLEHRPAGLPDDVRHHAGQLDVGILQRLLDPLNVPRLLAHQGLARPGQIADLLLRRGRYEAGPQQTVRQQLRQPGRIIHVGLAARDVAEVPRVHQHELDRAFEHVPDRLPVHARRLHRRVGTPVLGQPLTEPEQLGRRGPELAELQHHLPVVAHQSGAGDDGVLVHVKSCTSPVRHLHRVPPSGAGVGPASSKCGERARARRTTTRRTQCGVLAGSRVQVSFGLRAPTTSRPRCRRR